MCPGRAGLSQKSGGVQAEECWLGVTTPTFKIEVWQYNNGGFLVCYSNISMLFGRSGKWYRWRIPKQATVEDEIDSLEAATNKERERKKAGMIEEAREYGPHGARHLDRDVVEARGQPAPMATDEAKIERLARTGRATIERRADDVKDRRYRERG